jgi:hypothetical protein
MAPGSDCKEGNEKRRRKEIKITTEGKKRCKRKEGEMGHR